MWLVTYENKIKKTKGKYWIKGITNDYKSYYYSNNNFNC